VQPFGLGTPWITCAVSPTWIRKTCAGESLAMTVANVEKHLKSAGHKNALDTVKEDAADPNIEAAEQNANLVKDGDEDLNIPESVSEVGVSLTILCI